MVRTPGFHPGNRGSTPLGTTKASSPPKGGGFALWALGVEKPLTPLCFRERGETLYPPVAKRRRALGTTKKVGEAIASPTFLVLMGARTPEMIEHRF